MNYIVASHKSWNKKIFLQSKLQNKNNWYFVSNKEELENLYLEEINPRYIFFPHWSYIIPEEIYTRFECVIFHMTDVPFGRGGSPLQNLISREIYDTKLTALRCVKDLDAGPVYAKRDLALYGGAEEIYIRTSNLAWELIQWIVENEPTPVEQTGKPVIFSRRKPEQGDIKDLKTLLQVFDYIRMLDAEGYPLSFLTTENFKFEFSRPSFKNGKIIADVKITMRDIK